jgi:multidrug efflux pump subunit AcrA (membrane-fusion protein)
MFSSIHGFHNGAEDMAKKPKTPQAATETPATDGTRPGEHWIETQTATTEAALKEARELSASLLAEQNAGADVLAAIISIDDEIEIHEKMLRRLAAARAQRDAKNTKEARAARHEQTRKELQAGLDEARQLGEQVKAALVHVVELGARLSAIAETRAAIGARFAAALREIDVPERESESQFRQLRAALGALTLPGAFLNRLWCAGPGRHLGLSENVLFIKPFNDASDPDEVIAEAVERLRRLGRDALKAPQKEAV